LSIERTQQVGFTSALDQTNNELFDFENETIKNKRKEKENRK